MMRSSEAKRNREIGMLQAGASAIDASRTFNCIRNTVHELVRRSRITDDVYDRLRSGKLRATSMYTHLRNMFTNFTVSITKVAKLKRAVHIQLATMFTQSPGTCTLGISTLSVRLPLRVACPEF